jgi:hypothetical protein
MEMGVVRNAYKIFIGIFEGNRPTGEHRHSLNLNIKIHQRGMK